MINIIIPAFNAEKTIGKAIESALNQQGIEIPEIIVVDDGSSDQTAEIVRSFPSVRYVFQENAGPATARNRGAQEARGEYLFFTDADCIPHADWIARMMPHFDDPRVAAVAGSYDIANPDNMLARGIQNEIHFRHTTLMPPYPKVFGSYNFGIRKDVFDSVGGFDTSYRRASGEDNDLAYKILAQKRLIFFAKEAKVKHYHTSRVMKYLREQFRHGFWRVKMYRRHPALSRGDDYTFWKDIIEVPLSCLCFLGLVGLVFNLSILRGISLSALICMVVLQLIFGFRIMQDLKEGIFFSCIMLLRSFARTAGFFCGFLLYINFNTE